MTRAAYDRHKERTRQREAAKSKAGRDIAPMPPVKDPQRKRRALASFRFFCETYFPEVFCLPWSADHCYVIERIEHAVTIGGKFAVAMPRGTGKTSLCDAAVIWAPLTGHRRFIFLFASDQTTANDRLEVIRDHLTTNDRLLDDFPEVIYPLRKLENIANKARGQLYLGTPTRLQWQKKKIVLPIIAGSLASGAVIRAAGLDTNFRGAAHKAPDGSKIRPDLAIIDDPQTDKSAKSPNQTVERQRRIQGGILGLAGNTRTIAAVMPCTVIHQDDLADRMLDREKHPEWQGHRAKLLYDLPERTDLWDRWWEIRCASMRADGDGSEATAYYLTNQVAMDAGAKAAWPERHPGAVSAIEFAMILYYSDPWSFAAEYQNEPLDDTDRGDRMSPEEIGRQTNGHKRGLVPSAAEFLTAHIDVHKKLLYWIVCAWEKRFTGYVVDDNVYPKQNRKYFTLRDSRRTMAMAHPKLSLPGMLYAGLDALTNELLEREWPVDGGGVLRVERLGIDANWGESTDAIYRLCRQSRYAAIMRPMHGRFIGAKSNPLVGPGRKRKPGEIVGPGWIIPAIAKQGRPVRHITFDANRWKSDTYAKLSTPLGERGSLSLFEGDHQMLIDHLGAEYTIRVEARGRVVDEWQELPGQDNHKWDNLVGNAVLASTMGATLDDDARPAPRRQSRQPKKSTPLTM